MQSFKVMFTKVWKWFFKRNILNFNRKGKFLPAELSIFGLLPRAFERERLFHLDSKISRVCPRNEKGHWTLDLWSTFPSENKKKIIKLFLFITGILMIDLLNSINSRLIILNILTVNINFPIKNSTLEKSSKIIFKPLFHPELPVSFPDVLPDCSPPETRYCRHSTPSLTATPRSGSRSCRSWNSK